MFDYGFHHFNLIGVLFFLVAGHIFFDFAGQGEFMSQAKNSASPQGQDGVWKWALCYHAFLHAASVAVFTHSLVLGLFEWITHAIIDHLKCKNVINFHQDQCLHLSLKVVWAACAAYGLS